MKRIPIFLQFFFGTMGFLPAYSQSTSILSQKDLQVFTGQWQGSLTYLDYTSGKPYTMPAKLEVTQIGKTNAFLFFHSYPNEPKANGSDTLLLSADGKMLNEEIIQSKRILSNGNRLIITEYHAKDGNDNQPAMIRLSYLAGPNKLVIRKDILFDGQTTWIKRSQYSYTRIKH